MQIEISKLSKLLNMAFMIANSAVQDEIAAFLQQLILVFTVSRCPIYMYVMLGVNR